MKANKLFTLFALCLAAAALVCAWLLLDAGTDPRTKEKKFLARKAELPIAEAFDREKAPSGEQTPAPGLNVTKVLQAEGFNPPKPPSGQTPDPDFEAAVADALSRDRLAAISNDLAEAPFFTSLSAAKQQELINTLASNEAKFLQRIHELGSKGVVLDEGELFALRTEAENKVQSLLGPEDYQSYRQHMLAAPDRQIIAQTVEQLGQPLPSQATEQLSSILQEERSRLFQAGPPSPASINSSMAEMAERINNRAAAVLQTTEERTALAEALSNLLRAPKKPQ